MYCTHMYICMRCSHQLECLCFIHISVYFALGCVRSVCPCDRVCERKRCIIYNKTQVLHLLMAMMQNENVETMLWPLCKLLSSLS